METFAIRYNPRNVVIKKLIETLSLMKEVEVLYPDEFSIEDLIEIEKARKSGICKDVSQLEELLLSKL